MVRTRLGLGFFGFSILSLCFGQLVTGCDSGSHGDDDDDDGGHSGEDARGGTSSNKGGTTGKGGSTQPGVGGGSASGGTAGGNTTGGNATSGNGTGGNTSGGNGTGGDATGGTTTGGTGEGGNSGEGTGNAGGTTANGGTGGTVIGPSCDAVDVTITPETPTVILLVDTSTSMFESMPPVYPLLHDSLMDAMDGVVKGLEGKIRFGFASYKGHPAASEDDPACATMETVDPALDNYDAIEGVYGAITAPDDLAAKWETPTNYAIKATTAALLDDTPDVPSNKYILLVTDGNPNTCEVVDPQCGQDLAIKAAQDAYDSGVGLMVLGIGDIVSNPNSGCSTYARCGLEHLQDMANAGVGASVQPPPNCDDPTSASCVYRFESCNKNSTLKAAYTADSPVVGHYVAVDTTNPDASTLVAAAVSDMLNAVTSCTFHMNVAVTGDVSTGVVKLDGEELAYGDANGWEIGPSTHELALRGTACTSFNAGGALSIDLPCDQVEALDP